MFVSRRSDPSIAEIREEVASLRSELETLRDACVRGVTAMPDGTALVQTVYGLKFRIDPMDFALSPSLMFDGDWEPGLVKILLSYATPSTVFVDVGAGFGFFSCLMANAIGPSSTGKVFSFEPNPKLFELLKVNSEINWSMAPVRSRAVALASESGRSRFAVPREASSKGALSSLTYRKAMAGGANEVIRVSTRRLDDVVPDGTSVDVLRVAAEGYEVPVLTGAERLIAQSPKLCAVVDWAPGKMSAAGVSIDDFISVSSRLLLTISDPGKSAKVGDALDIHTFKGAHVMLTRDASRVS